MSLRGGVARDALFAGDMAFWLHRTDTLHLIGPQVTPTVDVVDPTLLWALPYEAELIVAWTERGVPAAVSARLPDEFLLLSPEAVLAKPGHSLAIAGAGTACFRFTPQADSTDEQRTTLVLNIPELEFNTFGGQVRVGAVLAEGVFGGNAVLTQKLYVVPYAGTEPFSFAVSQVSGDSLAVQWLARTGGAREVCAYGSGLVALVGTEQHTLGALDDIEFIGDLVFSVVWEAPQLAQLSVVGRVSSCKRHGQQILSSRWGALSDEVRGGIAGGVAAVLLTVVIGSLRGRTLLDWFVRRV
ncbi:MAG: hypothetical protein ACT4PE_09960 [Candidatus Eiseniibacteriota bacterium]